jgi:hypothetical protein
MWMMVGRWSGLVAVALAGVLSLTGCGDGGGGGGGRPATPTPIPPTSTPRPPTPTPEAALRVNRVFPKTGSAGGNTAVVVEGAGFSGAGTVAVSFNGIPAANVIVLNDRQVSCLTPPGAPGTAAAVEVSNEKGHLILVDGYEYGGGGSPDSLDVTLSGEPSLRFDSSIGTTVIVADYLVRDYEGNLLDEDEIEVSMFIDGEELGVGGRFGESVLDSDSEELDLNVLVQLVLDASYSLQQFDPPQFSSMLAAAENLVDEGIQIWSDRGGTFDWSIVWFDELIARPDPSLMSRFRISDIPAPEPGSFTKLYSAVSNALEISTGLAGQGIANGPRDRHVLVVFTDGLDNLSSFANPDVRRDGTLRSGDPFPRYGWRATMLDNVLGEIAQHPLYPENVTVHSIALGTDCSDGGQGGVCFDAEALGDIAQVGFGQLLVSPRNVEDLFDLIQREFTTLQSSGAVVALGTGEYDFRIVVQERKGNATGEINFGFRVTTDNAEPL